MRYGENDTVKFLEALADNVFRHNYSMMRIEKKLNYGKMLGLPWPTSLIPWPDMVCVMKMACTNIQSNLSKPNLE